MNKKSKKSKNRSNKNFEKIEDIFIESNFETDPIGIDKYIETYSLDKKIDYEKTLPLRAHGMVIELLQEPSSEPVISNESEI